MIMCVSRSARSRKAKLRDMISPDGLHYAVSLRYDRTKPYVELVLRSSFGNDKENKPLPHTSLVRLYEHTYTNTQPQKKTQKTTSEINAALQTLKLSIKNFVCCSPLQHTLATFEYVVYILNQYTPLVISDKSEYINFECTYFGLETIKPNVNFL